MTSNLEPRISDTQLTVLLFQVIFEVLLFSHALVSTGPPPAPFGGVCLTHYTEVSVRVRVLTCGVGDIQL